MEQAHLNLRDRSAMKKPKRYEEANSVQVIESFDFVEVVEGKAKLRWFCY